MYQDDEFGLELMRGADAALKGLNLERVKKTRYKRGATYFSSRVAKMKAGDCDLVVLGTNIRQMIGVIAEARNTGFNPTFLGSSASHTDLIHKLESSFQVQQALNRSLARTSRRRAAFFGPDNRRHDST